MADDTADTTSGTAPQDALDEPTRAWLTERHQAVLVTLRSDGSAQSSNVSFAFDGELIRVSVTADRAKTHNARRDPRVILHVLGDTFWQYLSVRGEAELSEVSSTPGDAAGQELLETYQAIAGPHDDPQDYFAAMVADRRLVLRIRPTKAVGSIG